MTEYKRTSRVRPLEKVLKELLGPSSSSLLRTACSSLMSLIEVATPEGGLLIYMFGLRLGEKIGGAIRKADLSIDPWLALVEVNGYLGIAEEIEILDVRPERAILSVKGPEEIRKYGGLGRCNFIRGFASGFLSSLTDSLVLIEESECCGLDECQLRLTMSKTSNVMSSSARRAIVEYLRVNPGAYLRQIARDLGMSLGSLRWHLNVLERSGLVWEKRKGNLTEFYLSDIF